MMKYIQNKIKQKLNRGHKQQNSRQRQKNSTGPFRININQTKNFVFHFHVLIFNSSYDHGLNYFRETI